MVLGVLTSLIFTHFTRHTGSLAITLAVLPPIVTLVIMMINGNVGAGLAVAGAFALVRFRSLPGTAKEVCGIFLSVSIGLACGMGYVAVAVVYFLFMSGFIILLEELHFGQGRLAERQLKITIPEDLDYEEIFDDLLEKYTLRWELVRVHTTNMGTLYELTYEVLMRQKNQSREFINELRCRNGNLSISLGRAADKESM
ncbi:MAG: DUF4956 domain-containing protein [Oscillospiraceae bacterium]|nr:DUF4956 domain-containing protein [Oscillospiraceae bacterium]